MQQEAKCKRDLHPLDLQMLHRVSLEVGPFRRPRAPLLDRLDQFQPLKPLKTVSVRGLQPVVMEDRHKVLAAIQTEIATLHLECW